MTPARREIFVRLIKVIVANIRYENRCIKDHDRQYPYDRSGCPRIEHVRDLAVFRGLLADTLHAFKWRRRP